MSSRHEAIDCLPEPFYELAPELDAIDWPDETRATCSTCPMAADDREGRVRFHPEIRCCTFHPTLPNFLLGRILERGDPGSERVRARIARGEGVGALGVAPSREWVSDYDARSSQAYGRDASLTCPYWVPGEFGCSIWADRGAVCRTWFCRHVDGHRGHGLWHALRRVLRWIELDLARRCVAAGAPPTLAGPSDWEAWYRQCARVVETLEPGTAAGAGDLRRALREAARDLRAPIPAVLVASVEELEELGDGVRLVGYSPFDDCVAPRWIFTLLEELDRQVPWSAALRTAEERAGVQIGEDWVRELFAARVIESP